MSTEITQLRRAGQLNEAYQLGQNKLATNPNDIWVKRAFSWVCYDLLKLAKEARDEETLFGYIADIRALELDAVQDKMLFDSTWWIIIKWVKDNICPIENAHDRSIAINNLLSVVEGFPKNAPSEVNSVFIKFIHAASRDLAEYIAYMHRIDFDQLMPADRLPSEYNGQPIMPLWEQILNAYSKCALRLLGTMRQSEEYDQVVEVARDHVKRLQRALTTSPEYKYTLYYLAKLLIALGDRTAAINRLMPFVRRNNRDFWVWQTMAVALKDSGLQTAMSCCCKGLLCKAQEDKTVGLRETAAKFFAACGYWDACKTEVTIADNTRMKHWGRHISDQEILALMEQPEYRSATVNSDNNRSFYANHLDAAEQMTYADLARPILITFVNKEKHIANFIDADDRRGFFRYDKVLLEAPKTNEVYTAVIERIADERFNLTWGKKSTDAPTDTPFFIKVQGFVKHIPENRFAFVDNMFISAELVKANNLEDGDTIEAIAIKSYDRKKNRFGWAIHEITACTKE